MLNLDARVGAQRLWNLSDFGELPGGEKQTIAYFDAIPCCQYQQQPWRVTTCRICFYAGSMCPKSAS